MTWEEVQFRQDFFFKKQQQWVFLTEISFTWNSTKK